MSGYDETNISRAKHFGESVFYRYFTAQIIWQCHSPLPDWVATAEESELAMDTDVVYASQNGISTSNLKL